jgi:trk system potassium uptake protein TrkA
MRVAFIGASEVTQMTAGTLIERGHEVVIIESDKEVIEDLSDSLDCSFLHGDGGNPGILREVGPEQTDFLFCLTDNDQVNIISGLVGRSLGFARTVVSIRNREFGEICEELGLDDTIVPSWTISSYLADLVSGIDMLELRTAIRGEARFFQFTAGSSEEGPAEELDLPEQAEVICLYRSDEFLLASQADRIKEGDEVVILTHRRHLTELRKRWRPRAAETGKESDRGGNSKDRAGNSS